MKKLLVWLIMAFSFPVFGQEHTHEEDRPHLAGCGVDADFLRSLGEEQGLRTPNLFPPAARMACGRFELYFADLLPGSPAAGFADPAQGAARRNTFCAVLTYVQSVFDFSNVPVNAPIRIRVNQSFAPVVNPAPVGTGFLAVAGPTFNLGTPGIIFGFVRDYAVTGIDPAAANQYHGRITVNFHQTFNTFGNVTQLTYLNNHTLPLQSCQYDLYSVLLHEVGHMLGFISYANNNGQLVDTSIHGNNHFSGLDFQLFRGQLNGPTGLQKLIIGTLANPQLNPALLSTPLDENNYWINGNGAPRNHPVYSGQLFNYSPSSYAAASGLSHMDEQILSYTRRSRVSPGYAADYVMGPFAVNGALRRNFTEVETDVFNQLGYPLNPGFTPVPLANLPPYSAKMAGYTNYENFDFAELVNADFTIVNNIGATLTIDLQADNTAWDPEGTPLTVASGTLINLRGCGNGGNNHAQLTVSPNGRFITFTPRPNFRGRAQFGFRLSDGTQQGSFHLYTIDVTPGTNLNFPPGSNLVINSNLEEGTEVKRLGVEEGILNSSVDLGFLREGFFMRGTHLADAHPFNYQSSLWVPVGGGDIVNNTWINCNGTSYTSPAGRPNASFPTSTNNSNPLSEPNSGQFRYRQIKGDFNYLQLGAPLQPCRRYVLRFHYANKPLIANTGLTNMTFTVGFTNQATHPNPPVFTFQFPQSIAVLPPNIWQYVEIPFTYCGTVPANILNLSGVPHSDLLMDNIEIVEVTGPVPPLMLTFTNNSPICTGSSTTLTAHVANALCDVSYLWSPGGATTPSITVSPSSTTTYSVTVTDGCRTTVEHTTVTVTIPPVIAQNPNAVVCAGDVVPSIGFTSGPGATHYTWVNNNPVIGLPGSGTGPLPSFTANNPAVYSQSAQITVTPWIGSCAGAPMSFTILVHPRPVLSPLPNLTVCAGQTVQATNYTTSPPGASAVWTNSNTAIGLWADGTGNVPAFVATNTTGSPITATITLTPVSGHCQGNPITYTITVNPAPNLTVTPAVSGILPGNSVTLNASGGSGYTWSPATGLSCTNCPSPVASPSSSTTYTVSSTNAYGCTGTATAVVNIAGPPCTNCPNTLSGTISTSPTGNQVYCINSSITISGAVVFSGCELKMAAYTQIIVQNGATLTLKGTHVYSCGDMWRGIQVMPGGRVVTENAVATLFPVTYKSTLIEDAMVAIEVLSSSPVTTNLLSITSTTFNRNNVGIRVSNYTPQLAAYPFSIVNSIFTSRNIPFTPNSLVWPYTWTIAGANVPTTPLANQVIDNGDWLQTGTAAHLKGPFSANTKPQSGLELINVGATLNAATLTPTFYEVSIGRMADVNIFDNLNNGVNLINSNFSSLNNIFQNTTSQGSGIRATSSPQYNNRLRVLPAQDTLGGNKFVDCGTAIRTDNYLVHDIRYSDVRSTQVNGNATTSKYGFSIKTNRYLAVDVWNNKLYNVSDGVVFTAVNGPMNLGGTYQDAQYAGRVNIEFNTIRPNLPGSSVTSQYVNNAIYVVNSGMLTMRPNAQFFAVGTKNNSVSANRGIYYANWLRQDCRIIGNTVNVLFNSFFITGVPYYGINVENCTEVKADQAYISYNTVSGFYTPVSGSNPAGDPNLYGIRTSILRGYTVACNTTDKTARGIGFQGGNTGIVFQSNNMQNHRYGFVLDNNAVIDQQGTLMGPAENRWNGSWLTGHFKTAALNGSSAQNSRLYQRQAAAYNPNGSGFPAGSPNAYSTTAIPQTLFLSALPPPAFDYNCTEVSPWSIPHLTMEEIVQDDISYSEQGEAMRYINKHKVYEALKENPEILRNSQILAAFYEASQLTTHEKLYSIAEKISEGKLSQAALSTTLLQPENAVEETYKSYYRASLSFMQHNFGQEDSTLLVAVAEKCPFTHGVAVYHARVLYNTIYGSIRVFADNCPEETAVGSGISNVVEQEGHSLVLFPNPASDEIFVTWGQDSPATIAVVIMDGSGKIVFQNRALPVREGVARCLLDVVSGVYIVRLTHPDTQETVVKKLIIQK